MNDATKWPKTVAAAIRAKSFLDSLVADFRLIPDERLPMPLSEQVKSLINNAWDDGYPCLIATCGPLGPNIGPKGSMIMFDDRHLAYWERTKRGVLENLNHSKKVCVMYSNFKAQRDGILEVGFLRFFGTAELYESGSMHDAIFAKLSPREQGHVGADTGIGVLIKIERATDMRGKELL